LKKCAVLSLLLGSIALAGCNTTAQDIATSIITASQTVNEKVASVRGYATQICAYVPTAATVISIFNSGYGTDVAAVANAICQAVTTAPLADGPGDHKPRVNGVVVRGQFVK
jgi:predicted small secreted protein